MATDATKVRVAVTGAVSVGDTSATAPTGTGGTTTGFTDLGYVDESGVVLTLPGEGDKTPLKAWQNGAQVRTLRTPSEDVPTFAVNFLETKLEVVEFVLGVTITPGATDGAWTYKVADRGHKSVVVDVVDGAELIRLYAPFAVVTAVSDVTFVSTDAVKFGCTISCDLDTATDCNFKGWATAFKTP